MRRVPKPGSSFGVQLVAVTSAVTLLGVIVLTLVVQVVLEHSTNSSLDKVLEDRTETVISSIRLGDDGALEVPDSRLEAGVAVYDDDGRLIAGSVPTSEGRLYAALATTPRPRSEDRPGDDESRILAQPFTVDSASGVVIVTERLAPYERAERQALWVCIGAGLLMVLVSAGLVVWVSRRALAPVAQMTRSADDWSEFDLNKRFDLGDDSNEIAALGRTLDRLLGRVANAIRSEQRLTSELAHELRTPLTAIQANADLALMHELPGEVRDGMADVALSARRMSATIEGLLELARNETTRSSGGSCLLVEAVRESVTAAGRPLVEIRVDGAVRIALPQALAIRAISPVLDNARRVATRVVVLTELSRPGYVDLCVDDDGPGIAADAREVIFEPGHTGEPGGAGLGLALSRRVARSMGGDVRVARGPLATRLVVTLPLS